MVWSMLLASRGLRAQAPCRLLLKAGNGIVTGNQFIKPKFIAAQVSSPCNLPNLPSLIFPAHLAGYACPRLAIFPSLDMRMKPYAVQELALFLLCLLLVTTLATLRNRGGG